MADMNQTALVYTVCGTEEEAASLSRTLVEERLAACTNYWTIGSCCVWQGELVQDREVAVVIKTVRPQVEQVFARVAELHSYELPCLLELPPGVVEPRYAGWIREQSTPAVR